MTTWPATRAGDGVDRSASRDDALPSGTRLHEFELVDVLGAGGFGIVYLARDHTLLRNVAVKEYLPLEFARRSADLRVVPRTATHAGTMALGLQSFVKEAQLLAGFDHPSLVKVHRFWEALGTAYMVMPHYRGLTLKELQRTAQWNPDEAGLRGLLASILSALDVLHGADVYHRDISPDNIMLLPDGGAVLLDFGSARRVLSDRTQALTAMFKPNFAAIEQYGEVPGMRQGPWTDLYALGAVMRFLITGTPPTPSAMRVVEDGMPALALFPMGTEGLSPSLLRAIDWALEVDPRRRPQSVGEFRQALGLSPRPVATRPLATSPPSGTPDADLPVDAPRRAPVADLPMDAPRSARGADLTADALGSASVGSPADPLRTRGASISGASAALPDAAPRAVGTSGDEAPTNRTSPRQRLVAASIFVLALGVGLWAATATLRSSRVDSPAPTPVAEPQVERRAEPIEAAALPAAELPRAAPVEPPRVPPVEPPERSAARESASPAVPVVRETGAPGPTATLPPKRRAPDPVPADAVAATPASPRTACGDRNFLSMAVCMDRLCRQPAYRVHAECTDYQRYAENRRRVEER